MQHLPPSMVTVKRQMKQTRKNTQSKITPDPTPPEKDPMEKLETQSNQFFTKIIGPQKMIATELTNQSPVKYNWGNKYFFVLYEYNINSILVRPTKARIYK